jgi:superfamily II DNA/RNA helicase
MGKVCKKCGYERLPTDNAPDYECPKCSAIYEKVDAFLKRKAEKEVEQRKVEEEQRKAEEEQRKAEEEQRKAEEEQRKTEEEQKLEKAKAKAARDRILTKTYTGSQEKAMSLFKKDSAKMAEKGYFPTTQSWAPGQYGCGAFLLALILSFVLIGLIVFVYMFIVKPPGTLAVTYELRDRVLQSKDNGAESGNTKVCPRCAETIKAAAVVCRFCGHDFEHA